jgi:pimeloyl-ACP methyl ester carboxylesterase
MAVSTRSSTNGAKPSPSSPKLTEKVKEQEEEEEKPFRIDMNAPRTKGFYIAGALALLVYSVTPLAWLTVIVRYSRKGTLLSLPNNGFFPKLWYCYCLAELPFSIYFQYLMWYGAKPIAPPKLDGEHLSRLLTKCLMVGILGQDTKSTSVTDESGLKAIQNRQIDDEEAKVLQDRLRVWFHYAPLEDIYEENLREWLCWAFAGRPLEEVKADKEMSRLTEEALRMIVHRLNWKNLKPGYNSNVTTVRLTLDKMKVLSRPLGYYVVCNGVSHGVIAWLRLFHGFRYEYSGECSFIVKPPTSSTKAKEKRQLPILFMHGLGIGIGQYMAFLARLVKHEDGVVILIQPHISADILHPYYLNPPNKDEQADSTAALLSRLNMPKVTTISHSNGTMVLGWLIRKHPEICAKNILVDPVSFRLWEGSVCYSFIYRTWITYIEVLLGYFVARELGTARTIGRNFQWSDMCLWVEDFANFDEKNLHFVFGETDLLVDVPSCVEYLRESGVPKECITVVPKYQHGKALMFHGQGMDLVTKWAGIPA